MQTGRSKSVRKVNFKINTAFYDNKIKSIDKQKEESLRWHIFQIEKLKNKKWKSLKGISPAPVVPFKLESTELHPDIEFTKATSFYAWDETDPNQNKSIITSTKPPVDPTGNSGEISFTEVTKFYNENENEIFENSNNTNSLLRIYPTERQGSEGNRKARTHIYIPHVNKEGRVVVQDTPHVNKEGRVVVQDTPQGNKDLLTKSNNSFTERESKHTNLEQFKNRIEKKIPKLGFAPKALSFPETNTKHRKPSILSLVNQIEKKKAEITTIRSRSNSRLSQALRRIEDESRVIYPARNIEVEDEAFLISLEEDSSIPIEESVARISSILEREDRAQDSTLFIRGSDLHIRRQTPSELQKRREECQSLLMIDMEQHHYVRKIGSREEERHDVTCGCNKYHGLRHSYSEVEV